MNEFVSRGRIGTAASVGWPALVLAVSGCALLAAGVPGLVLGGMLLACGAVLHVRQGFGFPRTLVHAFDTPVVGAVPAVSPEARRGGPPVCPNWGCGLSAGGRL